MLDIGKQVRVVKNSRHPIAFYNQFVDLRVRIIQIYEGTKYPIKVEIEGLDLQAYFPKEDVSEDLGQPLSEKVCYAIDQGMEATVLHLLLPGKSELEEALVIQSRGVAKIHLAQRFLHTKDLGNYRQLCGVADLRRAIDRRMAQESSHE